MEELIVLLNEAHRPIGNAPKLASHHSSTPLHLGFSCYIFNDKGQLLLTQRASVKKVWPGVWTNSVCGHPSPGESVADAITRRAQYELGISSLDNLRELLGDYHYRTPPFKGIIENEFCPVFAATLSSPLLLNPEEVQAYRWANWKSLPADIAEQPDIFSYWFKDQLPQLKTCGKLQEYLK